MTWTHIVCIPFVHACVFLSLFVCVCVCVLKRQASREKMKEEKKKLQDREASSPAQHTALPSYELKTVSQAAKKQLRLAFSAQTNRVCVTNPFVLLVQLCWKHCQVMCSNL